MSIDATLIAPAQLAALQVTEPVVVIDTRDADTFAAGHIPGTVLLDVRDVDEWYRFMKLSTDGPVFKTPDEVLAECATAGISSDDTVYMYCLKGARASNTFLALKQAGFTDVRMYFGSWNEWSRDDSLPIETGLPVAKPSKQPALALAA